MQLQLTLKAWEVFHLMLQNFLYHRFLGGVKTEMKTNASAGIGVLFTFTDVASKHGMRLYRENVGSFYYQITYNNAPTGKWMKINGTLIDGDPFT